MPFESWPDLRSAAGAVRKRAEFALGQWGLSHSEERLVADAADYWAEKDERWRNDSHWRSGSAFASVGKWSGMGREHLRLYERMRGAPLEPGTLGRMVDWGCGGGANAVAFAQFAHEVVGVDVNENSLDEAQRQMGRAGTTPFTKVLVDLADPESAVPEIPAPCDLFICLYVLELVPTPEYGLRLMAIAHELLGPGGHAFVQIKYATGSWDTRPRRRGYWQDVAGTTYRVDEFWTAMTSIGFRAEVVSLVPQNDIDERYAYFLLTRP